MVTVGWKNNIKLFGLALLFSIFARIVLTSIFGEGFDGLFRFKVWQSLWGSWDANIYQSIAEHGYVYFGQHATIGFWPLWPLVLSFGALSTMAVFWWGVIATHLLISISAVLFFRLIERDFTGPLAKKSIVIMSIMPTSFMFLALYSEALFLTLSLAVFLSGSFRRWGWAIFFAACLIVTRHVGIVILIPLAWQMWSVRRTGAPPYWLLVIPLVSVTLFPALISLTTGNIFSVFDYQRLGFRHALSNPIQEIWAYATSIPDRNSAGVALISAVFGLILILRGLVLSWKKILPIHYFLYAILLFLIPLSTTNNSLGITRYQLVIFPFAIILAAWLRTRALFMVAMTLLLLSDLVLFYFWSERLLITL